jgi:ABC-type cobalamin/Fe3+-siderophores transport system ATPase subunit
VQFSIADLSASISKRHHAYGTKLNVRLSYTNLIMQTGPTLRINNLSGEVQPGRFTAILGGSGAGKTSLMNCLLGREPKTSGQIVYSAVSVSGDAEEQLSNDVLQRLVAFVPQNDVFLRSMTVSQVSHSTFYYSTLLRAIVLPWFVYTRNYYAFVCTYICIQS